MAQPITWRNVITPGPSHGTTQSYTNAGNAIVGGIDRLAGIVDQQEALATKRIEKGIAADREGFLNLLGEARTPEALAALRQSGEIDRRFAALDPTAQAVVRNAEQARLGSLRGEVTAQQAFDTAQQDRVEAPIRDRIMSLALTDPAAAMREIQANPGLRNAREVYAAIRNGERDLTKFGWQQRAEEAKVAEETQRAALRPLELSTAQIQAQNLPLRLQREAEESKVRLQNTRAQMEAARVTAQREAEARQAAAEADFLKSSGNVYAVGGIYTPDRQEDLFKLMKDTGVGGSNDKQRREVIKMLSGYRKIVNGQEVPIPMGVLREAIAASSDPWYNLVNTGFANSVKKILDKKMAEQYKKTVPGDTPGTTREVSRNRLIDDLKAYIGTRRAVADSPR